MASAGTRSRGDEDDAHRMINDLMMRLSRFGLSLNEDKTRLLLFGAEWPPLTLTLVRDDRIASMFSRPLLQEAGVSTLRRALGGLPQLHDAKIKFFKQRVRCSNGNIALACADQTWLLAQLRRLDLTPTTPIHVENRRYGDDRLRYQVLYQ